MKALTTSLLDAVSAFCLRQLSPPDMRFYVAGAGSGPVFLFEVWTKSARNPVISTLPDFVPLYRISRCGVRSQSLSWFSSCVCRGCPRHFLYRSICIIRRICQCIQILPLVFSGNMPARTGPGGQTAAGHHHIFYRSGHICLSRSAGACWRLSRPSSTLPPIIAHFSVLSG